MKRFLVTSDGIGDAQLKAGTSSGMRDSQRRNEYPGDTASVTSFSKWTKSSHIVQI